jgi:hypothetical protein
LLAAKLFVIVLAKLMPMPFLTIFNIECNYNRERGFGSSSIDIFIIKLLDKRVMSSVRIVISEIKHFYSNFDIENIIIDVERHEQYLSHQF